MSEQADIAGAVRRATDLATERARAAEAQARAAAAQARLDEIRQVIDTYFVVHGNSTAATLTHARDLAEGIRQILDRETARNAGPGEVPHP